MSEYPSGMVRNGTDKHVMLVSPRSGKQRLRAKSDRLHTAAYLSNATLLVIFNATPVFFNTINWCFASGFPLPFLSYL